MVSGEVPQSCTLKPPFGPACIRIESRTFPTNGNGCSPAQRHKTREELTAQCPPVPKGRSRGFDSGLPLISAIGNVRWLVMCGSGRAARYRAAVVRTGYPFMLPPLLTAWARKLGGVSRDATPYWRDVEAAPAFYQQTGAKARWQTARLTASALASPAFPASSRCPGGPPDNSFTMRRKVRCGSVTASQPHEPRRRHWAHKLITA